MSRSATTQNPLPPSASALTAHAQGSSEAAAYLRALAHEFRIQAICHIGAGELSVQELEQLLGASQSNVSQHLAKLKEHGILASRKVGNLSLYRIADPATLELVTALRTKFCSVHPPASDASPAQ